MLAPRPLSATFGIRSVSQQSEGGLPTMRKLVVCNIVSLDGFYSGPGGRTRP